MGALQGLQGMRGCTAHARCTADAAALINVRGLMSVLTQDTDAYMAVGRRLSNVSSLAVVLPAWRAKPVLRTESKC